MLMKAEEARRIQRNLRKQEEADKFQWICKEIEKNTKCGKSTRIDNYYVSSKETIIAIEKMGYTVIEDPYCSKYIITVEPQEIANGKREVNRVKICERLTDLIIGVLAVGIIPIILMAEPILGIICIALLYVFVKIFFRTLLGCILFLISCVLVPPKNN